MSTDPFTLVYNKLWDMAESSAEFTNLVKLGNRVKLSGGDGDRNVGPEQSIGSSDLPEVILTSFGGLVNLTNTSTTSYIMRSFQWIISTGDMRLNKFLYPVEWAIFKAMADWPASLAPLEWNSRRFVKNCRLTAGQEGESNPELNRGIKGWSALWTIEVEMNFLTAHLTS